MRVKNPALLGVVSVFALASAAAAETPRVAADITPVHSLVARVMEGVGTPDLIVRPGASPHGYALRPSEAAALQDSEIVFWIGAELTPSLGRSLAALAENATHVELLDLEETRTLSFRTGATFEAHDHGHDDAHDHDGHDHAHDDHGHDDHAHDDHGHEDHAEHDDHAHDDGHDAHHAHDGIDPHAWLDPANAKAWVGVIAAELSQADPANAGTYAANAEAARQEIDAVVEEIETTLAPFRDLEFIVFHDAYQYFERRFSLSAAGAISLSDATDPSPARIEALRTQVEEHGIDCAFAEPQFDAGILDAVFSGTDVGIAVIDPMGTEIPPGADFYPALLRDLAQSFASCG